MNKNIYISFLFILLIFITFGSAEVPSFEENYSISHESESSFFQVEKLRYEPYPASPGDYMRVWIQVQKTGTGNEDVTFELLESYPFSFDSDGEAVRSFKNLNSVSFVMEFKVRVDENAVSGENTLELKEYIGGSNYRIHKFNIYLEEVQTSFDAVIQDYSDAVIQDYSDGEISIALANIGQNDAGSTIVRIPEQEGIVSSGVSGQMIGNLEQGDYTIVVFSISGKSNILQMQIDYTDIIGVRRSDILNVSLAGNSAGMDSRISSQDSDMNFSSMSNEERKSYMQTGEIPKGGTTNSNKTWIYYIIGIVILLGGYLIYKKKFKMKTLKDLSIPEWIKKEKSKK